MKQFLENGGTVVTIGSSVALAEHLGVPLTDHVVDASGRPLPNDTYYIPGSILEVAVDNTLPIAYGMGQRADVPFSRSPVFGIDPGSSQGKPRPVAWFDSAAPVRSGWAWGQEHLKDGIAMAEAAVGRGTLYLFGPDILHRSQPHGTYKLLFNAIYLATVEETQIR